jgi:hypothetical protein
MRCSECGALALVESLSSLNRVGARSLGEHIVKIGVEAKIALPGRGKGGVGHRCISVKQRAR